MNLLGLIFSILITATIVVSALFEKQLGAVRIHSTSIGHIRANRKILKSCEKELYKEVFSISHLTHPIERSAHKSSDPIDRDPEFPKTNPLCARLNLSPLLQEGKEKHSLLYEMAIKLFQTFYGETLFKGELAGAETAFFDALLSSLRTQKEIRSLEKLSFSNPLHRKLYYQMLKGTKECNLFEGVGYPALLDYICFEESPLKPCLFHAHPHLTAVFLGPKVALQLHRKVHKKNGSKLSKPLVEQLCSEAHHLPPEKAIFELFEFSSCGEKPLFTTFVGSDAATQVSLKKEISSS